MINIFQPTNKGLGVLAKEACNEASCKVSVNLAMQFQRRSFFKQLLTDVRTTEKDRSQ